MRGKIPFYKPYIPESAIGRVVETLKSGWITTGPRVSEFEQKLADFCGVDNVLAVNSATLGLELVLRWFGVGSGDEVIVPVYTYAATANVVLHTGAKPVFVDVGDDFNIDVDSIASLITERTKAIIPVDIAGLPVDYGKLFELVESQEIKSKFVPESAEQEQLGRVLILSDSAHSIGAVYKGKKAGALADVSVFSFHAVKNITTAEGGAILFNLPEPISNTDVYKYLRILSFHGQTVDAFKKEIKGNYFYDVVEPGWKGNMTDIQASLGLAMLEEYDNIIGRRKQLVDYYAESLAGDNRFILPVVKDSARESSYHLFMLRLKGADENFRNSLISYAKERNVLFNIHYKPLPMLSLYKNMGFSASDYPVAYKNYSSEVSLPLFHSLEFEDIDYIVTLIKEFLDKHKL